MVDNMESIVRAIGRVVPITAWDEQVNVIRHKSEFKVVCRNKHDVSLAANALKRINDTTNNSMGNVTVEELTER